MPQQAARLENLPAYVFAIIGEKLRQMKAEGIDVIRLDVGSPDMPPSDTVIDSLYESAKNPKNHGYSGYTGTPAFRKAVSEFYKRRFEVDVDPLTEVLPLLGSKEGIVNLCLAFLDAGDVALIPDIGYPSYAQGARLSNAEIYWLPVTKENGYLPDLSNIPEDIRKRAKILWVNYPNNPTGATADLDFYRKAVTFCKENDVLLASDNPYVDVTFDDYVAPSALEVDGAKDVTVEFMSFSKSYNMAGWRLGAAVGSAEALKVLLRVKSNMDSGHFIASYDAGIKALEATTPAWLKERNEIYKKRRDRILEVLPDIGLKADTPLGSLYIWAESLNIPSSEYVEQALSEAHVSLAPGEAYGPGGKKYVRISLGIEDDRLEEALQRLKTWYSEKYD